MFEQFTEPARKVMSLARQESQRLFCEFIGTEHILLGIIKEEGGVACKVLMNMKIDLKILRDNIEKLITPTTTPTATLGQIPFSPRTKRVIELAGEAASQLGHKVIGTEHLLLGLIKENEGIAAQVLTNLGLKLDEIRDMVIYVIGEDKAPQSPVDVPTVSEIDITGTIIDTSAKAFTVLQRDGTQHVVRMNPISTSWKAFALGRRIHVHIAVKTTFLD